MIKINEMAKRLEVSIKTLQRWDREGILVAKRTPTDRRYYTEDQYLEYIGLASKSKRKKKLLTHVFQALIKKMICKTRYLLLETMSMQKVRF